MLRAVSNAVRTANARSRVMAALIVGALAIAGVAPGHTASGDGLSDRPITIMVPFSASTGLDIMARLVGEELSKRWGQPVIIKNVTGASGVIGTEQVARAEPDGHTILFTATSYALNAVFNKNLPYDPIKDFRAIIEMARATWSLAVNPSFPAQSAQDFVDYVKANPGKVSYATPGMATPHYLAMELLKAREKLDMVHVPYGGQAQAVTDVLGGHVPVMVFPTHTALPFARAGKLRMLGVFADKRVEIAPDLPTMTEQGYPVSIDVWYGFLAPAKTPGAIVDKYNKTIGEIMQLPKVREVLAGQGLVVTGGTPEQLDSLVKSQIAEWGKVVEAANIPRR
jgi:tripartite-type tricarboxylate transporter receptor subunit TctC